MSPQTGDAANSSANPSITERNKQYKTVASLFVKKKMLKNGSKLDLFYNVANM